MSTIIEDKNSSWIAPSWCSWSKFSESMLRTVEKKILGYLKTAYRGWYVDIGPAVGPADKIWTISLNEEAQNTPLILLHGLGAGVALWCLNLDSFAACRPVYAIDILGFGRSSRPPFSTDAATAEQQFVKSIEEWRREMNLDKFILLGHSMGGFLAASYSLMYPQRVEHLILADPWGFPERTPETHRKPIPLWVQVVAYTMSPFNPLAAIRAAGPWGEWIINKVRPDIEKKFSSLITEDGLITQYLYQCNSQSPSGESAFHSMTAGFGWAKNPMVQRIDKLDKKIPITLLYGSRSWVDNSVGEIIKEKLCDSYVQLQVISGAGHHVYADKPEVFNKYVIAACEYSEVGKLSDTTPSANIQTKSTEEVELDHR
ncbi:hypothetical protein RN001_000389 [Aquatica leii]|uniref:1-acylglycerol-3-phosphate O-acyltransferase ABHD5 n=1 Tax=Aquatica leii TaxID=1421715 RepID=A0AAN7QM06_9COLE|nr:hypothetical protein RN001_000389 [Aquatica leii]